MVASIYTDSGSNLLPPAHSYEIKKLDSSVASLIAAGEVIERPASIVKELVENAVDAGASRIEISIENGGIDLIRVHDNGRGIPADQMPLAFVRHATSKLASIDDLFRIQTLGFRGEALASVASAAECNLITRPADASHGHAVAASHRGVSPLKPHPHPIGTTIEVRGLFDSIPARKKFLGTSRAESMAITKIVCQIALAYPDIAFRLIAENNDKILTPGDGSPRSAFGAVHSPELAEPLLDFHSDLKESESPVSVSGLCSPPSVHKGNRSYIHILVNGRSIQSKPLLHAIERIYSSLLPIGRHPCVLLNVTVQPDQVDVNIHPAKQEIKFESESEVVKATQLALGRSLSNASFTTIGTAVTNMAPTVIMRDVFSQPKLTRYESTNSPEERADQEPTSQISNLGPESKFDLRELRPIGQFSLKYILCEARDSLMLIDQHAADERARYETLLTDIATGNTRRQPLLSPIIVNSTPLLHDLARNEKTAISELGWDFELLSQHRTLIREVPALINVKNKNIEMMWRKVLEEQIAEENLSGPNTFAAGLACHSSIRAGDKLTRHDIKFLIERLAQTDNPFTCAHGRPSMIEIGERFLDKQFLR